MAKRDKPKVRGVGSNQHQDKPPATTASSAVNTATGKQVGGVVDTDPFTPGPETDAVLDKLRPFYPSAPIVTDFETADDWFTPCTKCGGSGEYGDKSIGSCFACKGTGRTFTKDGKAACKAAKDTASTDPIVAMDAAFKADPELADAMGKVVADAETAADQYNQMMGLNGFTTTPSGAREFAHLVDVTYPAFAHDIAFKSLSRGKWSTKQRDALIAAVAKTDEYQLRVAEEAANAQPAPQGRAVHQVEVVSAQIRDGMYGPEYKMLVRHADGWKAWMSIPKGLRDEVDNLDDLKGQALNIDVELEPKPDDPTFAIGKRPKLAWG